ncbi:MAG: SDR family oxidoreductase [Chloroflexota bacterium]|nr:SDR family oxidoreductase [Chloroflexota bacterium]
MTAATPRFQGRGAVVTGGATGIGGAIAERLAAEGASVLIADINAEGANQRAARIRDSGGTAAACATNVGELDQVQAMIQTAVDRWGRLDIIVNNAYPAMEAMTGGAEEIPPDVYDRAMAVLVKASYLSAKFGVPHLRSAGGGSIVNISSIHGLLVAPGALVYETGKAALIAATRQMAVEYGRDGIRVNAIAPGHIVTENIQAGIWDDNPTGFDFFTAQYPVGRCGRPEDIAAAVFFLCSQDASFITGHTLVVDGGHSLQIQENFGVAQAQYMRDHPDTQLPY